MIPSGSSPLRLRGAARLATLAIPILLGGCNAVVLHPAGDVAVQQRNLILWSTLLMLLIIVPVMLLTAIFAWHYRAGNTAAEHDPEFDHSTGLELVIWSAPLLIIICLGALAWGSSHLLDPYRALGRSAPGERIAPGVQPLEVQVVALDWKWLFLYPQYGIATVNELAAPVGRPIRFSITSSSMMNSFFVPALAGQIYAMPGMVTKLNAIANRPGEYDGFSANYSGAGFSDMKFVFHALPGDGFDRWVAAVKAGGGALGRPNYLKLQQPSEKVPVMRFAATAPDLYGAIVNLCVEPGKTCMSQTMGADMAQAGAPPVNDSSSARGSAGKTPGALQRQPLQKGVSPNMTSPVKPAPRGTNKPGAPSNRDLSMQAPAARLPGSVTAARA